MFDRHSVLFKDIAASGAIKSSHLDRLQAEPVISSLSGDVAADALLTLDRTCLIQDTAWRPFLVERVSETVIDVMAPSGYVTAAKGRWLVERISDSGRVASLSGHDILLRVLTTARWSPPSLSAFALRQVEYAVATGTGPLRRMGLKGRGRIGDVETDLIREILSSGERSALGAVTRAEAEVLLDLHETTAFAENCPEWSALMARVLAHLLLTASGYAAPAASLSAGAEGETSTGSAPSLGPPTPVTLQPVVAAYRQRTVEENALASLERQKVEIITAEPIAPMEPSWLLRRLGHGRMLPPTTRVVLTALRAGDRDLHPALLPLLAHAA